MTELLEGMGEWDLGSDSDGRCKDGEDMEPCRKEGVVKLVKPACLTFSTGSGVGLGGSGEGVTESLPRRKPTFEPSFRSIPDGRSLTL